MAFWWKKAESKYKITIVFYRSPENKESLKVDAIELDKFKTFEEAYENYDLKKYEKGHKTIESANNSMYKYYSRKDEKSLVCL